MDINDKTKDTLKKRIDLNKCCKRREVELQKITGGKILKLKTKYLFLLEQRRSMCK